MPNFALSSVPVQIAQSITDAALIQNLGDVNVYLDVDSSVSIAAYSIVLGPRDSINWKANTPLWGATAAGNTSSLSVLYGADGAALGSVTVVGTVNIDGDVHLDGPIEIAGPVTVQGTVDIGNIVQTEITNTVSTSIVGTVDTVVSGPVEISGTVPIEGDVNVSGPVTVTNTVAIDGTVDIDLPVKVQGGGSVLAEGQVTLNSANSFFTTLNVPAPADGLTYYGLRITLAMSTGGGAVLVRGNPNLLGGPMPDEFVTTIGDNTGWAGYNIGAQPNVHRFTVPMTRAYPYPIRFEAYTKSGAAKVVSYRIEGISAVEPFPRTDDSVFAGSNLYISDFTWAQNVRIMLPPSFQSYNVRWYQGNGSTVVSALLSYFDYWTQSFQPINTQIQSTQTQTGSPTAQTERTIKVPGMAGPVFLSSSSNANTGLAYISLVPN